MNLSYDLAVVRLFVHDWARAVRFYTDVLGMRLETRADEFGWAQFATGPCDPEGNVLILLSQAPAA